MRQYLIILLIGLLFFGCQNKELKTNDIKAFFENMISLECVDSIQKRFEMKFKYSFFNQENMSIDFNIPDSVDYSDFYNTYASRIISAFYNKINSDTSMTIEKLLIVNDCNTGEVRENVIEYCCSDKTFKGIYNEALLAFNHGSAFENKTNVKKTTKISLDSLINISMSYFDIVGYSEERGFAFHFVCGQDPFDFNYENRIAFLVSEFCQEALKNPLMLEAYNKIKKTLGELIKNETKDLKDFPEIKKTYEPMLYEMLKEEGTLKESLISYYEKRKNIEPFELLY